ncbi:MAG: lysoplasmalogenase family protein, partial [Bacteroidota bacterium]
MQNKSKYILILYIIIGALQVTGILLKIPLLHQSLKMLLMPVLIFYLLNGIEEKTKTTLFRLSILALTFSYSGDIILMIPGNQPLFFIGGLVSFLIAHLFYTKLFTTLYTLS